MNPGQEADEWLMAQVARGRREPLEVLIRRHGTPLLTFIRRMVGDRHRSEELFQEVFLAVWAKRAQYQFPRPFKPWLYAIALNKCRQNFRDREPLAMELKEGLVPLSAGPAPDETAISTETATLVAAAVGRLPAQQRAVVVLRIWDGLSYADIAATVRRTEGTV